MRKSIQVNSLESLPEAAREFLALLPDKKIVAFYGSMGVGKTTFVKVLCECLGVKDMVTSPTFSIVNEYLSQTGEKIFHFDFYRINAEAEAYDMGYEDYFYSGAYCFIEWPERIHDLLPLNCMKVNISMKDEQRFIEFEY